MKLSFGPISYDNLGKYILEIFMTNEKPISERQLQPTYLNHYINPKSATTDHSRILIMTITGFPFHH